MLCFCLLRYTNTNHYIFFSLYVNIICLILTLRINYSQRAKRFLMERMRPYLIKRILFILIQLLYLHVHAQKMPAFNTPYSFISEAVQKITSKDTLKAFELVNQAIKAGLFSLEAIENRKALHLFATGTYGKIIKKGISRNREKLQKPSQLKVVFDDINRFWNCFLQVDRSDAAAIFFDDYFLRGSIGLRSFYQMRLNEGPDDFVKNIRAIKGYYHSIKPVTKQFKYLKPQFITAAKKIEKLYPEAIFPPIYFLIGKLRNVGTPDGYAGMLIGTEHLCMNPQADTTEFSAIDKMMVFDTALTVPLIVHEYIHLQQKNKQETTLLELTIMEGVADYLTYIITGKYTNPDVYAYGYTHEQAIWKKFSTEMNGINTDDWLFNTYNSSTGYPGNLGYFIGFRICEQFYQHFPDNKAVIKAMLEIKDFNQFLKESRYNGK